MLQQLRDYWLPLMLFAGALLVALALLALVLLAPLIVELISFTITPLDLFADDTTVRRSSIAGAIGLIVTAFVFFRPDASVLAKKTKKPAKDTMAGA